MKRFLSILFTALILTSAVFAQDQGDEYDDGYVYDTNGAGDQYLKFDISAAFPIWGSDSSTLFHKDQLHVGVAFDLGYYRFLTQHFGVGGEVAFSTNWSIGDKLLSIIPITGGVLYQPSFGRFEFPLTLNVGMGYESWANYKYFPSLVVKGSGGCFFRINESWSAGLSGTYMWIPQFAENNGEKTTVNGMMATVNVGGRFHF